MLLATSNEKLDRPKELLVTSQCNFIQFQMNKSPVRLVAIADLVI